MARILLTTRCRDSGLYDYFRENAPRNFRWRFGMPRRISFGLRFLRQNIPGVSILEFPTRDEFTVALRRGWDAVGFSFYLEETNDILDMARQARGAGVPQLWAGNYGALTPAIQSTFDRLFTSYSEEALAQRLGTPLAEIQHPPLITEFRFPAAGRFLSAFSSPRAAAVSAGLSVRPRPLPRIPNPFPLIHSIVSSVSRRGTESVSSSCSTKISAISPHTPKP